MEGNGTEMCKNGKMKLKRKWRMKQKEKKVMQ